MLVCGESGLELGGADVHEVPSSGGREAQRGQNCTLDCGNTRWSGGRGSRVHGGGDHLGWKRILASGWEEQEGGWGPAVLSMPLPKKLKFRAMVQWEQVPERDREASRSPGLGRAAPLGAAQCNALGWREKGGLGGKGKHRERQQWNEFQGSRLLTH